MTSIVLQYIVFCVRRGQLELRVSNLDGVPLDGDGGDVGQVGARWVAIDGWPSWLAWRRQDHGGGGRSRSRRGGRGRRLLFRERRKVREKNPN